MFLRPCVSIVQLRTAHGFFDSVPDLVLEFLSMAVAEWALVTEEVTLEHSLVMCLVLPQNRQRFCKGNPC